MINRKLHVWNIIAELYFSLSGTVYQPGDSVLITDIGVFTAPTLEGAGSSLVCHTENVNSICCRSSDNPNGGRVQAEWVFPNRFLLLGNSANIGRNFTRSSFTSQVRMNRRNNALMPTGNFTCVVPDRLDSTVVYREVVTLILGE